ncbi:MAG: TetR/AcrR family transcriptional regulator [Sphingomonadales bacterium]|nr:TetR/AcrR family transcriptional regulator [Sphingomonadales bacterium]
MTEAHRRKKDPEAVRAALLSAAGNIVLSEGLGAASTQAIAAAAGVTKGAFFHHFPTRAVLLMALFDSVLADFENALAERMAKDPIQRGRFSRAYLDLSLEGGGDGDTYPLWTGLMADADLRAAWAAWLSNQIESHAATEPIVAAEIIRFASDGVWLNHYAGIRPGDTQRLRSALVKILESEHDA